MAGLKDMMAAQEIELIVAGAARTQPSRGANASKLNAKGYAPPVVVSL
jgi:hypothetical protein